MQIKHKRDGVFEKLFPITLGDNVMMNNGKSIETWKRDLDELLNNIEDNITAINDGISNGHNAQSLWNGNTLLDGSTTLTPSKPLDLCRNGWLLIFRYTGSNNNFNYIYIPKHHLVVSNSGGIKIVLGSASGTYVQKYVYANSNTLSGHSTNSTGGNEKMELVNIYEY